MPLDLIDDKSTLVQVMAWCRQAASHYLSQCWPRFMSPNGVTRPQWVKVTSLRGQWVCTLHDENLDHIIQIHIYFLSEHSAHRGLRFFISTCHHHSDNGVYRSDMTSEVMQSTTAALTCMMFQQHFSRAVMPLQPYIIHKQGSKSMYRKQSWHRPTNKP